MRREERRGEGREASREVEKGRKWKRRGEKSEEDKRV